MSRDGQASACLYAFDILWHQTQDLRGVELIGRRRLLAKPLKKAWAHARTSTRPRARDKPLVKGAFQRRGSSARPRRSMKRGDAAARKNGTRLGHRSSPQRTRGRIVVTAGAWHR